MHKLNDKRLQALEDDPTSRWRRRERKTRRPMRVHGQGTKRLAHRLSQPNPKG